MYTNGRLKCGKVLYFLNYFSFNCSWIFFVDLFDFPASTFAVFLFIYILPLTISIIRYLLIPDSLSLFSLSLSLFRLSPLLFFCTFWLYLRLRYLFLYLFISLPLPLSVSIYLSLLSFPSLLSSVLCFVSLASLCLYLSPFFFALWPPVLISLSIHLSTSLSPISSPPLPHLLSLAQISRMKQRKARVWDLGNGN